MPEDNHRDLPAPPPVGRMTHAEIARNIAIKTGMRPAVDNQGRPIGPGVSATYEYDDRGRITGVTTAPLEPVAAYDAEQSPVIQAMREKASRNGEAIREFFDASKNDPASLGNHQH